MRSILRQDPDIVMVGEIRYGETADLAIRAAITGHLVLSTLHTNDAASTILRLVDMGVAPYMVVLAFNSALTQMLDPKVTVIDAYSYIKNGLDSGVFATMDGLHYDYYTSKAIYEFMVEQVTNP